MSNQEKIVFLKRYTYLQREIDRKLDEIECWRSRIGKITACYSSQPAGGGSIYKGGDYDLINKIVDLQDEIYHDIVRLETLSYEIRQVIESVQDDRERQLLQYRYLDGKTFEWIATEMHYHWQWIHRLHKRALRNLEIKVCREV